MADATTLVVSNGHVDSLIDFVLDVKPFHTKLSEVVEEYLFEDSVDVSIVSDMRSMSVLGLDYTKSSQNVFRKVWEYAPLRPDSTLSADKIIASDGRRLTYPFAPVLFNKLFSESGQDKFVVVDFPNNPSTNDTYTRGSRSWEWNGSMWVQIAGDIATPVELGNIPGSIAHRRFDGPGIPKVQRNGVDLVESISYHISHGAFSFTIDPVNQTWQSHQPGTEDSPTSGELYYDNVYHYYGTIEVANWGDEPEEFLLTWNSSTSKLVVTSLTNGDELGQASFGVPFIDARITFTFKKPYNAPDDEVPVFMENGMTFLLTPKTKIYVNPSATAETWTLIKTNSHVLTAKPVFAGLADGPTPSLSIYAFSMEWAPTGTYTITFTSPTTYSISGPNGAFETYPKHDLDATKSFKDNYLHFSINANGRTFAAGEQFTFRIRSKAGNAHRPHWLVYGSVSGWSAPATPGKYYYNGAIGFKIPELKYFACHENDIRSQWIGVDELKPVHQSIQPSKYDLRFTTGPSGTLGATVKHNIHGYARGLKINSAYHTDVAGFTVWDPELQSGDTTTIYLTPVGKLLQEVGYDEFPFDEIPYDTHLWDRDYPLDLLQEYFPLYHSKDCVIIPSLIVGDEIIIDKVESDSIRFRLEQASDDVTLFPGLLDNGGWIPLFFEPKYIAEDSTIKNGVFPNKFDYVKVYSAADRDYEIMTITQKENEAALLTFNETFFEDFVTSSSIMTIRFHQQSSWAQTVNVKVSEHLLTNTSDVQLAPSESQETATTGVSDLGLYIYVQNPVDQSVNKISSIYTPTVHDVDGLRFDDESDEYIITFNGVPSTEVNSMRIVPDVGSVFYTAVSVYVYDQIAMATSAKAVKFTVPSGTGAFLAFTSDVEVGGGGFGQAFGVSFGNGV